MDEDVIVGLERLKKRRQQWEKMNEEDGAFYLSDDEIDDRQIMTRRFYEREGHKKSFWYLFVHERDLTDLNGRDGKLFRNRFTVPYPLYLQLLVLAERWFPQKEFDVCGRETTPVFLKLLGTLRMLGKGCSWDLLYELSGVSAEVHRKWTLNFIAKFCTEMYPVYVHGPRNSDEIASVTALYAAAGFPGCVGSTDCVHIRWEMCPVMWSSAFKNGKNNYASISYEMTVDHTKRFQATTIGHYGTTSDMTIVKFDGFVTAVRFNKLFTESEFKVQVDDDKWVIEKGLYLLVDGGYHKWRIMQCPLKHTVEEDKSRWSEFAESVRKDVECSFGILKKRFQFLKNAITWHRKSDIDNAVFSCVILHNMLHEFNGYDVRWEAEIDNLHNDEEEQLCLDKIRRRVVRAVQNNNDFSDVGHLRQNMNNIGYANALDNDLNVEMSTEHELLQNKLVRHLDVQYLNGKLRWLKI